jgi:ABC-type lipoprotein release transport system permease subunit
MRRFLLIGPVFLLMASMASPADTGPSHPVVLLSRQLMRDAGLRRGDTVVLAADASGARSERFQVGGVYEPVPDPMRFNATRYEARVHLPDLIRLTTDPFDPQAQEAATAINLKVADIGQVETVARRIVASSPALVARPTARPREGDPFAALERFHVAIATITLVGSTAFLLALMIIRAEERRQMVGMLRLIGISARSIVIEILLEGVMVAIVGAAFGIVVAAAAQHGINAFFQARYDTPLVFVQVTPAIALECLLVSLPVGIVTGAVASWTLLRRAPAAVVGR